METTIGIWGDSITYGGPEEGWVGLLRKSFFPEYVEVYNRGICGDTSEDLLKRFTVEADAIQPNIVIIAVGANDSKHPKGQNSNKVSLEKFSENIQKLVALAKSITSRISVVGLLEVNESKIESTNKFLNSEIIKYDAVLREISKKENIEFINMLGVIDIHKDLEDGIHPNHQGYVKMFEIISKKVNQPE